MATDKTFLDVNYNEFTKRLMQIATGPQVKIRVGGNEYQLSKDLLCKQSSYFRATFDGSFKEGKDEHTTLHDIDGVVTPQSFEMLLQWMTLGRVVFKTNLSATREISQIIEFLRIADMYRVTGMEQRMAERVKEMIVAGVKLVSSHDSVADPDANALYLTAEHIESAVLLPREHPVRTLVVSATVRGYFLAEKHKFYEQARGNSDFAVDLLKAVKIALMTFRHDSYGGFVKDPISAQNIQLPQSQVMNR